MYILDIVLVVILFLALLSGIKKGFFATLFELLSSILAFFAAKLVSSQYAPIMYENFFKQGFEEKISSSLQGVSQADYSAQITNALDSIPDSMTGLMNTFVGIDKQALIDKVSNANLSGQDLVQGIISIFTPIIISIVSAVLFVVLSILFLIAFKIIVKLLDKVIKKLPAIKQANKLLGGVAGALKGAIIVVVISMLLALIAGVVGNEDFIKLVNDSMIINTIRDFIATFNAA